MQLALFARKKGARPEIHTTLLWLNHCNKLVDGQFLLRIFLWDMNDFGEFICVFRHQIYFSNQGIWNISFYQKYNFFPIFYLLFTIITNNSFQLTSWSPEIKKLLSFPSSTTSNPQKFSSHLQIMKKIVFISANFDIYH